MELYIEKNIIEINIMCVYYIYDQNVEFLNLSHAIMGTQLYVGVLGQTCEHFSFAWQLYQIVGKLNIQQKLDMNLSVYEVYLILLWFVGLKQKCYLLLEFVWQTLWKLVLLQEVFLFTQKYKCSSFYTPVTSLLVNTFAREQR